MLTARRIGSLALAATLALAAPAFAQDQRSLADVKAELTTLNGQIQQLRDELVRTGAAGGLPGQAATALTRLDQLEAELRFLTDRVDVLTNDVIRITDDASNRVVKQAVARAVHGRAGWDRRRRAQPRDARSCDRPQRSPARSGRRGLSADRDPRTCGDRDRHRRRRARAVPGGPPAAPRRHRGLAPVAGADRRQRGCRRGRDPARGAVREPGRRPHRRAGQLAARGGRARRPRDRVRSPVAVPGFERRPGAAPLGGRPTRPRPAAAAPPASDSPRRRRFADLPWARRGRASWSVSARPARLVEAPPESAVRSRSIRVPSAAGARRSDASTRRRRAARTRATIRLDSAAARCHHQRPSRRGGLQRRVRHGGLQRDT